MLKLSQQITLVSSNMQNKKIALVTGGNRGLGLGFVNVLMKKGYHVIATCREPQKSNELASLQSSGTALSLIDLDIADSESVGTLGENLRGLGIEQIDMLINNAGINSKSASSNDQASRFLAELDENVLLHMFDVNAVAPILVTRALLPFLANSSDPVIAFVSSQRASFNDPEPSDKPNYGYAGSKVALNMFVKELAKELDSEADGKYRIFSVHPGSVETDMNQQGVMTPVESAAKIVGFAENFDLKNTGKFFNYDGNLFPL